MIQSLGFLIGKVIIVSPGIIFGWLHLGVHWALVGSTAIAAASVLMTPTRPIPKLQGAPTFVRTKAFGFVAVIFGVLNLACYGLLYLLSPR